MPATTASLRWMAWSGWAAEPMLDASSSKRRRLNPRADRSCRYGPQPDQQVVCRRAWLQGSGWHCTPESQAAEERAAIATAESVVGQNPAVYNALNAERAIRPFVIGRKNWLFSGTPKGAHASALICSLIKTAKASGQEPYAWLRHVLERLPLRKGANFACSKMRAASHFS